MGRWDFLQDTGVLRRSASLHPAQKQPEPTRPAAGPASRALHPSTPPAQIAFDPVKLSAGGGVSPVWVLYHPGEVWRAAERRDSTNPWSLLSSKATGNRSGFASRSVTSRALSVVGLWFHRLEFYSAIMFEQIIALSCSNESDWKTEPR